MFIEEVKNSNSKKISNSSGQQIVQQPKIVTERAGKAEMQKINRKESVRQVKNKDIIPKKQSLDPSKNISCQLSSGSIDQIRASTERKSNHNLLSDHKHLNLNELAALFIKNTDSDDESGSKSHARSQSLQRLRYSFERNQKESGVSNKITTLQRLKRLQKNKHRQMSIGYDSKESENG